MSDGIADQPAESIEAFDRHGIFVGRADRLSTWWWRVRIMRVGETHVESEAYASDTLKRYGATVVKSGDVRR